MSHPLRYRAQPFGECYPPLVAMSQQWWLEEAEFIQSADGVRARHWADAVKRARGLLDRLPRWVGPRLVGDLEPTPDQFDALLGRARRRERRADRARRAFYRFYWVGLVVVGVESSSWLAVFAWGLLTLALYAWLSRVWIACVDAVAQIEQQECVARHGAELECGLLDALARGRRELMDAR